jgi:flagellar biosynthesis/type III secretory pathway chaperone
LQNSAVHAPSCNTDKDIMTKTMVGAGMSHTHELYTDLLTILQQMVSHYHQLLELSEGERQVIAAASLPALLELTTQKETLLLELSIMEEGRQVLLRKLADQLSMPVSELTLGQLGNVAPEPFAARFQCCRVDLRALTQAVSQVNAQNTALLDASLETVRTSLGLISRLLEPAPTYGHSGYLDAANRGGKVLHKTV